MESAAGLEGFWVQVVSSLAHPYTTSAVIVSTGHPCKCGSLFPWNGMMGPSRSRSHSVFVNPEGLRTENLLGLLGSDLSEATPSGEPKELIGLADHAYS